MSADRIITRALRQIEDLRAENEDLRALVEDLWQELHLRDEVDASLNRGQPCRR
jgi:hypothetical protein